MKLFDRFDKVYCINLKKRPDRLKHFIDQTIKFDLGKFDVFEAVDGTLLENTNKRLLPGEIGHIHTTIKILEDALLKKYETILLVEDDCVFLDEIKNIKKYFTKLPNDWEMLYFGGNHNTHVGTPPPKKINDNVVKLHNTYTSHCIGIKKVLFEKLISELKKLQVQTDVVYRNIQRTNNVYCFNPIIATQLTGFSDIQNKNINYNFLIY